MLADRAGIEDDAVSILALTRQNLPALRPKYVQENLCARGAYEISPATGEAQVTIFATGSEVEIAVAAQAMLQKAKIPARVVSVPSFELFARQPEKYRKAVIGIGQGSRRGRGRHRQGWERFIGDDGIFIGMKGFGASGPYEKLYEHFGITPDAIVKAARAKLKKSRLIRRCNVGIQSDRRENHDRQDRNQRIWPHRPQRRSRHLRIGPQGHRHRRRQRSRTGRNQRPPDALRFGAWPLPARGDGQGRHHFGRQESFKVLAERDPSKLPWKDMGVDIAMECTGIFTARDKASMHLPPARSASSSRPRRKAPTSRSWRTA